MGEETSKGPELSKDYHRRTVWKNPKSCFHDALKHRTTASRDNVGRAWRMQRHPRKL